MKDTYVRPWYGLPDLPVTGGNLDFSESSYVYSEDFLPTPSLEKHLRPPAV
jgi:hypothetical protein